MTTPQLLTKTVNRCRSASNAPKRLYIFAVTSLTLFLICQIVWREPITGYVASARIEFDCSAACAASPPREEDVQLALTSDSSLNYILAGVEHLRSYIRVRTIESSADRTAYEIRLVGTTGEEATELANAIGKRLSELSTSEGEYWPLSVKNAESKLNDAGQRDSLLRQQLQLALSEHCDSLTESLANAEREQTIPSEEPDSSKEVVEQVEPEEPAERLNPLWVKLNAELMSMKQNISRLRVERTDEHPLIKNLNSRAHELSDRLSRVPRALDLPQPENPTPPKLRPDIPHADEATMHAIATLSSDVKEQLGKLSRLSVSLEASQTNRLAAEDNLVQTAAEQPRESQTKVAITPATVIDSIGGTPPLPRVALFALVSVVFGGVISMLAARAPASANEHAEDTATNQQTPSTGFAASSKSVKAQRISHAALRLSRICEIALVGLVVLIVVIALSDSPLAAGFLDDPFQTLSEVIQRTAP